MLKLLVVEDHALVREGLVRLLGQVDDEVAVTGKADFESALAVLDAEEDFDLILLDLALPGIDGFSGAGHPAQALPGNTRRRGVSLR
jgi:CheY-like chemotaxis protein